MSKTNGAGPALPEGVVWPLPDLYQALQSLASAAGLPVEITPETSYHGPDQAIAYDRTGLDRWMMAAAQAIAADADPLTLAFGNLEQSLAMAAPFLLRLPPHTEAAPPRFLAILKITARRLTAVDRLGKPRSLPLQTVVDYCRSMVGRDERQRLQATLDVILPESGEGLVDRLLEDQIGGHWIAYGWRIRLPAAAPLGPALRHHRLISSALGFGVTHALVHGLWLISWILLGQAIFAGRFTLIWFLTWALSRLSMIPLRAMGGWFQGRFSIGFGGLLKRRLLGGSFGLDVDTIKVEGVGRLIGRVLESETLENLLLQGGFMLLSGVVEIAAAFWVLSRSGAPAGFVTLLLAWLLLLLGIGWGYGRARTRWTRQRLGLTHELTEKMTGHQTRLVQLPADRWHAAEDEQLAAYLEAIRKMDGWYIWLRPLIVNGWLAAAAVVVFSSLNRYLDQPVLMAITVGGILATAMALNKLVLGTSQVVDAAIATRQIRRFLTPSDPQPPPLAQAVPAAGSPLLTTHQISFRYPTRGQPVIDTVDLEIHRHDRILLESRSGGGKSTLVALLAGLRDPQAGLILYNGLDIRTFGRESWRRQIAIAPQFHENHIFLGTLAFNLLMGRRWPSTQEDLAEAEAMCEAIGLRPLLNRMPSGLQQVIGETGWKLSHGERTRIYLARALLQKAPITILDESFGALDPVTLKQVMATARRQDTALVVIAHP